MLHNYDLYQEFQKLLSFQKTEIKLLGLEKIIQNIDLLVFKSEELYELLNFIFNNVTILHSEMELPRVLLSSHEIKN